MMKIKVILLCICTLFLCHHSKSCDLWSSLCYEAIQIEDEKIVVGTITNSFPNSVELSLIDVLYGVENNSTIIIWDAETFECNAQWPNNANDMGTIGDTILCMIESIVSIENPWDVIGDYRRVNSIGGFATYTNFSIGNLFDGVYNFNEVLSLDFATYCCNQLNQLTPNIGGLPSTTGSLSPISLTAFPAGGTFSGPGVILNAFNPTIAGPGSHTITYTFNDEFGCSFSTEEDILLFTVNFNFVNYNLGTISPKITIPIQIEINVIESDKYTLQLFDLNGRQHYYKTIQLDTGIQLQEILLNQQVPKGVYLLKIANSQTHTSKKLMFAN